MADPTTWTNIGSPVSGTSVPVSGLTPGASYDLRVIATGPGGSATSSVLTVTTGTYVLPGAPGAPVIGVITSNSVALTWGLSTTGTVPINYQAQYRLAGQTTWSLFGSPAANASSVTITGLTASSNYEFSVVASNPAGTTVSGVTAAKTASASAAPSPPSGLNVQSASANSLTIGWSASSGTPPITYQPQYRPSGSGTWINVGSATSETSVQVTNLSPGTSYDFQVIASGPGGSATSSVLTVSTPAATTPPSAPVNFAITAIMTTGASLSWETPASGTRPINYQPQYRLSGTTVWSSFGSLIPSLTVTITGLLSGRTYDFQVVATNSGGSTPSAILTAATIVPPSFPSSPGPLTPWIITPTSVSLSWPGSKGSATPVLYQPQYRAAGSSDWFFFGNKIAGTNVTISGLAPGFDYEFQVVASNTAGSTSSDILKIFAPTSVVPVVSATFQPNNVLRAQDLDDQLNGKLDKDGGVVGPLSTVQTGIGAPLPSHLSLSRNAGGINDAPLVSGSYIATFRDGPAGVSYGSIQMTMELIGDTIGRGPLGNAENISSLLEVNALRSDQAGPNDSKHSGIVSYIDRAAPTAGVPGNSRLPDVAGLRSVFTDRSNLPSSRSGALTGLDVVAGANGLDDTGVRTGISIKYGESTDLSSGGVPADYSCGLFVGASTPNSYAQTIIKLASKYSNSALDMRGSAASTATITSNTPVAPVTTLAVSDALAFAGGPNGLPTSASNPKLATINGNQYLVTGVSLSAGLQSGVLTFASSVSIADAAVGGIITPDAHTIWLAEDGAQPNDIAFNRVGTTRAYADAHTHGLVLTSADGAAPIDMSRAQSLRLPTGGTQQRPGTPKLGDMRANSDAGGYEVYLPAVGGWASVVTSSATGGVPPGPATALVAGTPSNGSVSLSWTAPTSGTTPFTYQPQYRVSGTTAWTNWGGASQATSTIITGLAAGTRYDFQVVTQNSAGSSVSATTSVTMPAVAPSAPTGVTVGSPTSTTLAVSWTASSSGTTPISYVVNYRVTGQTAWIASAGGSTSGTSQTLTGLAAATTYDVQVVASNTAGSAASTTATGTTSTAASVAPSAPTGVSAGSPTPNSLLVSWVTPASGSTPMSYTVSFRPTGQTTWTPVTPPTSATSLTVTGLAAATSYDFQVAATNSAGSATSGVSVGVTAATPVASSGTVAGSQNTGATNPVISGPATGSIVVNNILAITGITITDPAAAVASGSCTLVMSCTSGRISSTLAGSQVSGSGTTQISYSNTFSSCQTVAADLVYTAPASAVSDNVVVKFTDQSGNNHQISIAISVTAGAVSGGTFRDPALQPFTSDSVYNIGIGSNATWSAPSDADTVDLTNGTVAVNAGQFSIPVYIGVASDPLITVKCTDTVFPVPDQKIRVPANAAPSNPQDATSFGQMVFFDRTQPGFMWGGQGCVRNSDGSITCQSMQVDNVCSDFVTHDIAVGGTNTGTGLIRLWELQAGSINHALRFSLPVNRVHSPGASWDVNIPWPNGHEDFNGPSVYTGHVDFGSTIGIPTSVNLNTLGLSAGGLMLGKALQTYGAIMRDTGASSTVGPVFYAEQAAEGNAVLSQMRSDAAILRPLLRIMRNQSANTPNGGGTYPTPVAQLDTTVCPIGGSTAVIASDSGGELAQPAQIMLDGFGVNTHIDNAGYQAIGLATIENCINYLGGIKLLRDSAGSANDSTWWAQVGRACNITYIAYVGLANASSFDTLLNNVGGVPGNYIAAFEGCQEADTGQKSGYAETLSQAAAFQSTVNDAGIQYGVPVIQMSFGQGFDVNPTSGNYGTVGDLSALATYGNAHTYSASSPAASGTLTRFINAAKLATPGKPVAHTEFGWRQIVQSGFGCVSQNTAAAYLLQFIFDAFIAGAPYYIWYELMDDAAVESNSGYGLFTDSGTPKATATAVKNLFTLLSDASADARTFSPGLLNYTVSGMPAVSGGLGGGHCLLQKSDGSFWLALWNEQVLNNTSTGADLGVSAVNVTLTLPTAPSSINVYDPVASATPVQTVTSVSSVTISLPPRVILVKIVK
jgi:hypothetical protein